MAEPASRQEGAGGSASSIALWSWAFYDWASNAFATVIVTFVFAAYFTRQVAPSEITGSLLWGWMLGLAGIATGICGPILGAVADHGRRTKSWIAVFTLACVAAMALLWFVRPSPDYLWPALIFVAIGVMTSEFAMIFYNAMLPALAPPQRIGRWSGWAWAMGYVGGVACLAIAFVAFMREADPWFALDRSSAEHVRATFLLAAAWYLLFSLPLFLVTPDRRGAGKPLSRAIRDGMRQLWDSLREAGRYRHIVRFLIARMIYIDGLATLFAFGGVYAAGVFDMAEQEVLTFGIMLNAVAGLGAAVFGWLDDRLGSRRVILISLGGLILFGASILFVESLALFWTFGMGLSLFVGPLQAASRSYLARAAPERLRNEAFGLYALSGKATAFLGPLMVGSLTALADSQRVGMSIIVVFFLAGFLLMRKVPEAKPS